MQESKATKLQYVRAKLRSFPDFPIKGIQFWDVCPILKDPEALGYTVDLFEEHLKEKFSKIDHIVGLDARGFLFGPLLAQRLGIGFILIRKKGKLPGPTVYCSYALEYGMAEVEMQADAVEPGQKVVVIDDLIATGAVARKTIIGKWLKEETPSFEEFLQLLNTTVDKELIFLIIHQWKKKSIADSWILIKQIITTFIFWTIDLTIGDYRHLVNSY